MVLKTVVIPTAGLGTRMLPYSKEVPKEMLPIITRYKNSVLVKPILHYIFDALYDVGFRRYYFVVGRGKRIIEDYFTPDWNYIEYLESVGKKYIAKIMREFYKRIEEVEIVMINQPYPRGFGDAVLRTKNFMIDNIFVVHAGDDIVYPNHTENLQKLINYYLEHSPKVAFLYDESDHPERYGVIVGEEKKDYIIVEDVIEKPHKPPSRKVVIAIYVFDKDIYNALEKVKPGKGEHQLTDAIRYLLKKGEKVIAVKVSGKRLDFGTPEYYFNALKVFVEENLDCEV